MSEVLFKIETGIRVSKFQIKKCSCEFFKNNIRITDMKGKVLFSINVQNYHWVTTSESTSLFFLKTYYIVELSIGRTLYLTFVNATRNDSIAIKEAVSNITHYVDGTNAMVMAEKNNDMALLRKAIDSLKIIPDFSDSQALCRKCKRKLNESIELEEKLKQEKYEKATAWAKEDTIESLTKALSTFPKDWKDSNELVEKYKKRIDEIHIKKENDKKDMIYAEAIGFASIFTMESQEKAIKSFKSLLKWKDSEKQICICQKNIKRIKNESFYNKIDRILETAQRKQVIQNKKDDSKYDSRFSLIKLKCGSTLNPSARIKYRDAMGVKLDCFRTPTTVVAEKAANKKSTGLLKNEDSITETSSEAPLLRIQYEPVTTNETVNVVGSIENIEKYDVAKIKIDSVKSHDGSVVIWTSGWIDFIDAEIGLFDVNVHVTPFDTNCFIVRICDKTGLEIKADNNYFEIKHNGNAQKSFVPTAAYSVCVFVSDGFNNILKPLVLKNSYLPAEGASIFTTTKELNPNEDDSINIQIWNGEYFNDPDVNKQIGCIRVKSSDLDCVLPAGTTIVLIITQDKAGINHVTGYIPDADYIIPEETFGGDSEHVSLTERMDAIKEKILELDVSLKKLINQGVDVTEQVSMFRELDVQFDEAHDLIGIDSDSVQKYIKDFYDLHSSILNMERKNVLQNQGKNRDSNVDFWKENVKHFGTNEQKEQFNGLVQYYTKVENATNRQLCYEKMANEHFEIIIESFVYLHAFYKCVLDGASVPYKDNSKASNWKTMALTAIENEDVNGLREAVFKLLDLKVVSANESINAVRADLNL